MVIAFTTVTPVTAVTTVTTVTHVTAVTAVDKTRGQRQDEVGIPTMQCNKVLI